MVLLLLLIGFLVYGFRFFRRSTRGASTRRTRFRRHSVQPGLPLRRRPGHGRGHRIRTMAGGADDGVRESGLFFSGEWDKKGA